VAPLVLPGDPVLTPRGGTFTFSGQPLSMNPSREIAVEAYFERPGLFSPAGVFVIGPSGQREVIAQNDPMPGTGGLLFYHLDEGPPRINAFGDVTFVATTDGSSDTPMFVTRAHVLHRVEVAGEPVPDRAGVDFGELDGDALLSDAGQLVLHAYTSPGNRRGLFLATPVAPDVPLAPPLALAALVAGLLVAARVRRGWRAPARTARAAGA
jgi:hypothetical protein